VLQELDRLRTKRTKVETALRREYWQLKEMTFKQDARLRFRLGEWAWQDALYAGMFLASLVGLIYAFTRK
jgi:hypothetical protein